MKSVLRRNLRLALAIALVYWLYIFKCRFFNAGDSGNQQTLLLNNLSSLFNFFSHNQSVLSQQLTLAPFAGIDTALFGPLGMKAIIVPMLNPAVVSHALIVMQSDLTLAKAAWSTTGSTDFNSLYAILHKLQAELQDQSPSSTTQQSAADAIRTLRQDFADILATLTHLRGQYTEVYVPNYYEAFVSPWASGSQAYYDALVALASVLSALGILPNNVSFVDTTGAFLVNADASLRSTLQTICALHVVTCSGSDNIPLTTNFLPVPSAAPFHLVVDSFDVQTTGTAIGDAQKLAGMLLSNRPQNDAVAFGVAFSRYFAGNQAFIRTVKDTMPSEPSVLAVIQALNRVQNFLFADSLSSQSINGVLTALSTVDTGNSSSIQTTLQLKSPPSFDVELGQYLAIQSDLLSTVLDTYIGSIPSIVSTPENSAALQFDLGSLVAVTTDLRVAVQQEIDLLAAFNVAFQAAYVEYVPKDVQISNATTSISNNAECLASSVVQAVLASSLVELATSNYDLLSSPFNKSMRVGETSSLRQLVSGFLDIKAQADILASSTYHADGATLQAHISSFMSTSNPSAASILQETRALRDLLQSIYAAANAIYVDFNESIYPRLDAVDLEFDPANPSTHTQIYDVVSQVESTAEVNPPIASLIKQCATCYNTLQAGIAALVAAISDSSSDANAATVLSARPTINEAVSTGIPTFDPVPSISFTPTAEPVTDLIALVSRVQSFYVAPALFPAVQAGLLASFSNFMRDVVDRLMALSSPTPSVSSFITSTLSPFASAVGSLLAQLLISPATGTINAIVAAGNNVTQLELQVLNFVSIYDWLIPSNAIQSALAPIDLPMAISTVLGSKAVCTLAPDEQLILSRRTYSLIASLQAALERLALLDGLLLSLSNNLPLSAAVLMQKDLTAIEHAWTNVDGSPLLSYVNTLASTPFFSLLQQAQSQLDALSLNPTDPLVTIVQALSDLASTDLSLQAASSALNGTLAYSPPALDVFQPTTAMQAQQARLSNTAAAILKATEIVSLLKQARQQFYSSFTSQVNRAFVLNSALPSQELSNLLVLLSKLKLQGDILVASEDAVENGVLLDIFLCGFSSVLIGSSAHFGVALSPPAFGIPPTSADDLLEFDANAGLPAFVSFIVSFTFNDSATMLENLLGLLQLLDALLPLSTAQPDLFDEFNAAARGFGLYIDDVDAEQAAAYHDCINTIESTLQADDDFLNEASSALTGFANSPSQVTFDNLVARLETASTATATFYTSVNTSISTNLDLIASLSAYSDFNTEPLAYVLSTIGNELAVLEPFIEQLETFIDSSSSLLQQIAPFFSSAASALITASAAFNSNDHVGSALNSLLSCAEDVTDALTSSMDPIATSATVINDLIAFSASLDADLTSYSTRSAPFRRSWLTLPQRWPIQLPSAQP